ncbi:TetR/AcrR family transcriptional regulator [Limimaricola soesokkakensis]|uniref:TetR/AcrR family transcriptional regulator n=1 Tax=Limimaricola soesokkakensis TaxID=1343159 RepID=UPI003513DC70
MTRRADAQENRAELLAAASDVFAEQGVDAPLDLVRQRAKVGRATMYRHFPDRRGLHVALVEEALLRFEAVLPRRPGHAVDLFDLLDLAAREAARSPALHSVWDKLRDTPVAPAFLSRFRKVFTAPLEEARAAGRVPPHLTVDDLFLAVRMLGAASRGSVARTRDIEARRALHLLMTGLGHMPDGHPEISHGPS